MPFPSREIKYYMSENDEKEFLDFVKSCGDVVFFESISRTPEFQPLLIIPKSNERKEGVQFYAFNRSVSNRFFTRPPSETKLSDKDCYSVNWIDSSVVCLGLCDREQSSVFYAGMCVISHYLEQNASSLTQKEPEFLKWFEKMVRWINKRYTKLACTAPFIRIGPDAGKLFEEGRLTLIMARNPLREVVIEGNLINNRQVSRNRINASRSDTLRESETTR